MNTSEPCVVSRSLHLVHMSREARVFVVGMTHAGVLEAVKTLSGPDGIEWVATATSEEGWVKIDPIFTCYVASHPRHLFRLYLVEGSIV